MTASGADVGGSPVGERERSDATPFGWVRGTDGVAYPPQPWHLGATLLLGVFAVPRSRLPAVLIDAVPDGVTPVGARGRAVVGVAFVRYHPGGVLAYRELLVAVLGRSRFGAPRQTIGQIWVDSAASRTGGRELWAIPKELGVFAWEESGGVVRCGLEGVAQLEARPGMALVPRSVRLPVTTAQRRDFGVAVETRSRAVARPRAIRAVWSMEAGGPLGYLAGYRPVAGLALCEASLTFGGSVSR